MHRFLEVAIGILVALAVVALWPEKDGAPEFARFSLKIGLTSRIAAGLYCIMWFDGTILPFFHPPSLRNS
jgi:hypothetical protein